MKRRRFYEADGSQEKRSGAPFPKGRPQESNFDGLMFIVLGDGTRLAPSARSRHLPII
jgi:hypothetical protein